MGQVDLNNTLCEWEKSNENDRHFLESLDEENFPLKSCHKDAIVYRKSKFVAIREELAQKLFDVSLDPVLVRNHILNSCIQLNPYCLFQLFHKTVFQNRFESEIPMGWNIHMRTTAGFWYYRYDKNGSRCCRIELSTKVRRLLTYDETEFATQRSPC